MTNSGPLLPVLARLRISRPSFVLDLRGGVRMTDLRGREIDAALSAGGKPPDTMVGRKFCRTAVVVYRSASSSASVDLDQ